MIASHYAEPVERTFGAPTELRAAPSLEADILIELPVDAAFLMLDESLGWAWGYAGTERRVGYVPGSALAKH